MWNFFVPSTSFFICLCLHKPCQHYNLDEKVSILCSLEWPLSWLDWRVGFMCGIQDQVQPWFANRKTAAVTALWVFPHVSVVAWSWKASFYCVMIFGLLWLSAFLFIAQNTTNEFALVISSSISTLPSSTATLGALDCSSHSIDLRDQHPSFCDFINEAALWKSQHWQLATALTQIWEEEIVCWVGSFLDSFSSSWSPPLLNKLLMLLCSDKEYSSSYHWLQQPAWVACLSLPGQSWHIQCKYLTIPSCSQPSAK